MRHLTAALAVAAVTVLTGPGAHAVASKQDPSPAAQPPEQEPASVTSIKVRPGKSKGTGKLTPIAGADKLIAPLGVDPACPAKIEIGMRSDAKKAGYADLSVEIDQPLSASRSMLSSYLPPSS